MTTTTPRTAAAAFALSLAASVATAIGWTVVATATAGATSCAPAIGATPERIADGTAELFDGGGFFDHYELAVLGTVVDVRSDMVEGSPTYGRTEVDLEVAAVLGKQTAPATFRITTPDPGWMAGVFFEVGRSYFVPLHLSEGSSPAVGVCDPVTEVTDPAATADRLAPLAEGAGIAFAVPTDEVEPTDDATGQGGGSDDRGGRLLVPVVTVGGSDDRGGRLLVPVVTVVAVAGAAGTAVALLRRRR